MNKFYIIDHNKTVLDAINYISKNGSKSVIITKQNKFVGILTDGDIRKLILNKKNLKSKIQKFYNSNPIFLKENNFNNKELEKIFLKKKIDIIPIVNKSREILEIITFNDFFRNKKVKKIDIPVVIMAGGKGTRLKPVTNILPKPLIPLKDKPILDYIVDDLNQKGFEKFIFILNYFANLIKSYVKQKKNLKKAEFVIEKKPLGTAGGLYFLKKYKKYKNFIVTNADTILKFDINDLISYHEKNKNHVTVVASNQITKIKYGVCHLNRKKRLKKIEEKPTFKYLANTGFYIINSSILNLISKNKHFDFTELIEKVLLNKKKVGVFPILEDEWIDVGQWREFEIASKKI